MHCVSRRPGMNQAARNAGGSTVRIVGKQEANG
jgi:hypothetical protein